MKYLNQNAYTIIGMSDISVNQHSMTVLLWRLCSSDALYKCRKGAGTCLLAAAVNRINIDISKQLR